MSDQWCVLLNTGTDFVVYGPMDVVEAEGFAAFMTATVDPAAPRPMRSPTREMLAWHQSELDRNNCTHAPGCEVHPDATETHGFTEGGQRWSLSTGAGRVDGSVKPLPSAPAQG